MMAFCLILLVRDLDDFATSAMSLRSRFFWLLILRMNSCLVVRETAVALPARRAVSARGYANMLMVISVDEQWLYRQGGVMR